MEIHFSPDIESRLHQIAAQTGRGTDQLVQDLVMSHIDHEEWFRREVLKGLASLDQGDYIGHEEVGRRIESLLRS